MSYRFALYLAPEPEHPLWAFGSQWLGYDAQSQTDLAQFRVDGISVDDMREVTAHPRLYGFHLTLKAPFRLNEDAAPDMLEDAIRQIAARHAVFGPIALEPEIRPASSGRKFLCLVPSGQSPALHKLEADAVIALDRFRAPLSAAEIARRSPDALAARERKYLETFGYPHVLEAYRPHFSLTGPVVDSQPYVRAV
ncbi:MAG: DUF1045 domain-containing protein, partial [Rhabdaerophilum sp.]